VTPRNNDDSGSAPSQWMRSNLVALGSAAVLAVYAAGFARTKAAADRFAGEDTGRRRPVPAGPGTVADAAEAKPVAVASTPAVPEPTPNAKDSVATVKPVVVEKSKAVPATASTPAAPSAVPLPVPASAPVAPPAPVAAPVSAKPAPVAADTSAQARPKWKDGVFLGWGSSRHGDIQAAVEIKDGEILSASIAQCLTQYSCSWIDALPPQVVTRQSAEVDYVSGATQSSNAFYYAVLNALKLAK
jgi:uncharacterized protein with FMN-binding domain